MTALWMLVVWLAAVQCFKVDSSTDSYALPEGMFIGAGVSAIQTEGAWNVSGKAESAADYVLHLGKLGPLGFSNPHEHDVAADSYNRYKEDIAMAAKLKFTLYRFSISWSRLLPDTNASNPNMEGVQYYHNFIDEILRYNMTPLATLYHFDHPRILEDQFKGWQGEEMITKFKEYARFVFNEYAGKVKLWVTINEPNVYCIYFPTLYHMSGIYSDSDMQRYTCLRNMVLAHAEAYHVFKEDSHDGRIGFNALLTLSQPNSTRFEDVYVAEAYNELQAGLALDPVVHGDWPQYVKDLAGSKARAFTPAEQERMKGTTDFLGFNVYFSVVAAYTSNPANSSGGTSPMGTFQEELPLKTILYPVSPTEEHGGLLFSVIQPEATRLAILWAWQKYKRPLLLTENGMGDIGHFGKHDEIRAAYFSAHLRTLVKTVKEFDVDMLGYCAWSLIDCFEWSAGYNRAFGLVHVDYENGTLDRSLKDSSSFWIELGETGVVPLVEIPSPSTSSSIRTSVSTWQFALALILAYIVR